MRRFSIHRADALAWLADRRANSVHGVVTDPPFGVVEFTPEHLEKMKNGNGGIWRIPQKLDGITRRPMPRFTVLRTSDYRVIQVFHRGIARQLIRVLTPGAHVIMASQVLIAPTVMRAYLNAGFEFRGEIVRLVRTLRGGDRPKGAHVKYSGVSVIPRGCWEPWLIFRKPCGMRVSECLAKWGTGALRRPNLNQPFEDVVKSERAPRRERELANHPSIKPQSYLRPLVRAALPLGRGILLDPFMGSGSTVAAAAAEQLYAIGVEINKEYYQMATSAIVPLSELVV